jgi:hypothetical protein
MVVRGATVDNKKRRMRFACWVTKAKSTRSEYVIHIPFPQQPWLRNAPQCSIYIYIACLLMFEKACVYWAVDSESLNVIQVNGFFVVFSR